VYCPHNIQFVASLLWICCTVCCTVCCTTNSPQIEQSESPGLYGLDSSNADDVVVDTDGKSSSSSSSSSLSSSVAEDLDASNSASYAVRWIGSAPISDQLRDEQRSGTIVTLTSKLSSAVETLGHVSSSTELPGPRYRVISKQVSNNNNNLTCIVPQKPNSITLASSELAPNMFGASSQLVRSWLRTS